MRTRALRITAVSVVLLVAGAVAFAQDKPAPTPPRQPIPLKVQVVIARFQGEKKIASAPYTLAVATSEDPNRTQLGRLRIGTQVPIPAQAPAPPSDGKPAPPSSAVIYRDVGTNIDCMVRRVNEGSFEVQVTIEQSSILDEQPKADVPRAIGIAPVLRSFRFTNSAVLRDGQTTQFTSAADAITGEVVRVDVTVNVAK